MFSSLSECRSSSDGRASRGGLLTLRKQGRHKYFALANDDVAALLETLMSFSASQTPFRVVTGPRDAAMRGFATTIWLGRGVSSFTTV